jgi:predicted Zn-dependent protease
MTRKYYLQYLICCLAACALLSTAHAAGADSDYQEALKALHTNDYTTAFRYLESAIDSDPDNVRYTSEYRQAAIRNKAFDRSLEFFEKLSAAHPGSANVHLNYGFAYVDKIPAAGSITQVILANNALKEFTRAVELKESWISYYTRGMSYLFWPKVFERAGLGVADLEKALKIQRSEPRRPYHVKTYIGLGDGYWKTGNLEKARVTWQAGLKEFPENADLKTRLAQKDDQLKATIEVGFDPGKRVDTDLKDLWADSDK